MADVIIQLKNEKTGDREFPITHVNAIRNSDGDTLPEILEEDYHLGDVAFLDDDGEDVMMPEFIPGFFTGTCDTTADTAAKALNIAGYELVNRSSVAVTFTNGITVANATLNISGKGAKPIYYRNAVLAANVIKAGDIVTMAYNGTRYEITNIEKGYAEPYFDSATGFIVYPDDYPVHYDSTSGMIVFD